MLFSATQTKSIKDLARLSLQNPEYVAVRQAAADPSKPDAGAENQDEESKMLETPKRLEQHYMVVSLDKKLDMLWSFVKMHLYTKTLVFLSSCKQVSLPPIQTCVGRRSQNSPSPGPLCV